MLLLLRQFVYGCSDYNLVLKLRLNEKEDNVISPDYDLLLLSIRREEARRIGKQSASKIVQTKQVAEASGGTDTSLLWKQVASLH